MCKELLGFLEVLSYHIVLSSLTFFLSNYYLMLAMLMLL
jgi:hypothetical protein